MTRGGERSGPDGPTPDTPAADGPPGDPETTARTICLRMLTAAPRTRAQLAEALAKRGIPDDVAQQVLDRLVTVGLIDDAAYAEAWVRSRHESRGLARRALVHELRRRGGGLGCAAICSGGGQGDAIVVEVNGS